MLTSCARMKEAKKGCVWEAIGIKTVASDYVMALMKATLWMA